jgi:hypothetical protein
VLYTRRSVEKEEDNGTSMGRYTYVEQEGPRQQKNSNRRHVGGIGSMAQQATARRQEGDMSNNGQACHRDGKLCI